MISSDYVYKKLFAIAMVLLVVGGLNIGLMALTGKDFLTVVMGRGTMIANGLFLAIGLSALAIAFFRDSYLPFLGPTIVPSSLLAASTPEGADYEVRVLVKPGQKVMFWAAEPDNKELESLVDWRQAYLSFRNAGVAIADQSGYVTLKVRKPQPYQVPMRRTLSPHIHYRVFLEDGMLGRVETVTLDGKEYFENLVDFEGFTSEADMATEAMQRNGFALNAQQAVEGFESPEEAVEEAAEEEDVDEGFRAAMPPAEEEEGFSDYAFKGQHAPVPASTFNVVQPDTAEAEINAVVNETARRSLMAEVDALDESPNKRAANYAPAEFL
jgi:uncharacterized membrane protein YuzA (DUF378 family)